MPIENIKKTIQAPVLSVEIGWLLLFMVLGVVVALAEETTEQAIGHDFQADASGSTLPV